MNMKNIQVYIRSLADLLELSVQDFANRAEYQAYKKNKIYQYRDELISKFLHVPISKLQYAIAEQGKPYLLDHPLQFNHSHSQNDYALALSLNVQDLGVDIESLDRKIRFEALAQHAFHPQEYQCWKALGEDINYWFKVWTTKEALLKAHGMGIRLDLNTLNISSLVTSALDFKNSFIFAMQSFLSPIPPTFLPCQPCLHSSIQSSQPIEDFITL